MPQGLYIDARRLKKGAAAFDKLVKQLPDRVSDVLNANALAIEASAKIAAPGDRGLLRQTISADTSKPLQKHITANAPYAAYVEFGTGILAAQYVASLPADYQTFAAQFKRGKMRSIKSVLFILMDWFKRVGIKDKSYQYFIAKKIFLKGVHPHPFLIPALIKQQKQIIRDMATLLKTL